MPKLKYRKIYDDDGNEMIEGEEVVVNGEHLQILYFDDNGEIRLENWSDDDFIFTIKKKKSDDRFGELDDPILDTGTPSVPSKGGRRADVV